MQRFQKYLILGIIVSLITYILNDNPSVYFRNEINSSDNYTLQYIQNIINEYVNKLSQQNYDNVQPFITVSDHIFPHLSLSNLIFSLSDHSIFIGGDSTAENTGLYLLWILQLYLEQHNTTHILFNFKHVSSLTVPDLTPASLRIHKQKFPIQMNNWNNSFYLSLSHNISIKHVKNFIIYKYFTEHNITFYGQKVQKCGWRPSIYYLQRYSFDVMIINFDVFFCCHLFSPQVLKSEENREHKEEIKTNEKHVFEGGNLVVKFQLNIQLEQEMNRFVEDAIDNDVHCMILYGPNAICDDTFYGAWKEAKEMWKNTSGFKNETVLNECLDHIGYKANELIINHSNTSGFTMNGYEFCKFNTLTYHGSEYMHKRMVKWIEYKQRQIDEQDIKFKLLYWNQWQITNQRCNYTPDGRHYYPLLPVRAEIISNIVAKWC